MYVVAASAGAGYGKYDGKAGAFGAVDEASVVAEYEAAVALNRVGSD